MAMLHNSDEEIVVRAGSSNANDIPTRIKQVLDSQSIDCCKLPSANSVQLIQFNVQMKMEVVQAFSHQSSVTL